MRCPQCSKNHPRSGGMKCSCGYRFVFDPKQDGIADGHLVAASRKASGGHSHYFTLNQLSTELATIFRNNITSTWVGAVFLLGLGSIFYFTGIVPLAIFCGLLALIAVCLAQKRLSCSRIRHLKKLVHRYEQQTGPFSWLLRDDRPLQEPPPDWDEVDIYDYGAEGILILERPLLVDLFVLNGFHTEHRIVVVSQCGYPRYLVSHVNRLLRERPDLPVSVLHDSTEDGMKMAEHVSQSAIFDLQQHTITDLGLRPQEVSRMTHLKRFARSGVVQLDHLRWARLSAGGAAAMVSGAVLGAVVDSSGSDAEMSFG